MQSPEESKDCFGQLDRVFPITPQGVREVPQECWDCPQRVECLRAAVGRGEGAEVIEEEKAIREEESLGGAAGFFKRWSRLKVKSRREDK